MLGGTDPCIGLPQRALQRRSPQIPVGEPAQDPLGKDLGKPRSPPIGKNFGKRELNGLRGMDFSSCQGEEFMIKKQFLSGR
jgi:hypothetical protein